MLCCPSQSSNHLQMVHRTRHIGNAPDENVFQMQKHTSASQQKTNIKHSCMNTTESVYMLTVLMKITAGNDQFSKYLPA